MFELRDELQDFQEDYGVVNKLAGLLKESKMAKREYISRLYISLFSCFIPLFVSRVAR